MTEGGSFSETLGERSEDPQVCCFRSFIAVQIRLISDADSVFFRDPKLGPERGDAVKQAGSHDKGTRSGTLGAQLSAEVGPVPCDDLKGGVFALPNSGVAIEAARAWP